MSGPGPLLTTHRRLGPGAVLRIGALGAYRAVTALDGEPHLVRDELGGPAESGPGEPLLCLVHITDLQLPDVQSPTRFEFLNEHYADPRYRLLVPVQRPQEALAARAVEATLRTLRGVRGPATGLPLSLAVTTGDAIDNAQWNELQAFLALFDGGLVTPGSGGPGYEGVQSPDWPGEIFWQPGGDGTDLFQRGFGFPRHPGLIERALAAFNSGGLNVPWLSCFGNHEALIQGVGALTPGVAAAQAGDRKPAGLPADFDHDRAYELFIRGPEAFMAGPYRTITADAARRPVTRREFVAAHLRDRSEPHGHGFTARNVRDGTAYYSWDMPAIRFIALDTACLTGGADGCVDRTQARWLASQLAEVHSVYLGPGGEQLRGGGEDRLVIVFSHHGTDTLGNTAHAGPDGEPLLGGAELLALLHQFPNVVLWLNGHTHLNRIRPRPDPAGRGGGFWEVTTSAVMDWPCQTRVVELAADGEFVTIATTMVDHDGGEIAALHRELALNVPWPTGSMAGEPADRNAVLRVPAPFPLGRLHPLRPLRPFSGRRACSGRRGGLRRGSR